MTALLALVLGSGAAAADKPAKIAPLTYKAPDGDQMIRLILWSQFWARIQQMNPGTTVNGNDADVNADLGIRRARALIFGKPNKRMLIMTHFGINNQTFNNARKPQLYIHDAWIEGEVVEDALTVGVGLHYFNGVSRAANESTMAFLTLDGPIFPWVNIERTDQFARQFGFYAKGKLSKLDYRIALNRPFTPGVELGEAFDFNPNANTWAGAGYVKLELADPEGNTLPFLPGTYLGKKTVVNIGAGAYFHPEGTARLRGADNVDTHDQLIVGVDVFADAPVGEGAVTAYGLYQYSDYGEDYVRNVGIMNVGAGGTSFAGAGNAYPMIGSGHTVYAQAGYLLPTELGTADLQPYAALQYSALDALGAPMVMAEAGANLYLAGQHAKITAHWRNRPVFQPNAQAESGRANEGIVQFAFRY